MIRNKHKFLSRISGFTLAEVLITLSVIGVIAAMTIPALLNNTNDTKYRTAYKKAYSSISRAFANVKTKYETTNIDEGNITSIGYTENFLSIKDEFRVMKECTNDGTDISNCWNTSGERWRAEESKVYSFIDTSGMAWRQRAQDQVGKLPIILVDINGSPGPNKYGKDRFPFIFINKTPSTINPNNIIYSYPGSIAGDPTRIVPFGDVINSGSDNKTICPSLESTPCYYTSWLIEEK